jgi:N-acetylglucosamine-6-sulfatase
MRTPLALIVLAAVVVPAPAGASARAPDRPPNIVFVLADDLSWNLVRFMPEVRRMRAQGTTFRQFIVSDSLCCSSRATILTGSFPHDTHVLGNTRPDGGYGAYVRQGARRRCVAIALRRAGYRTALMGKYLNGYHPNLTPRADPGWDVWVASSWAYEGFNYWMSDNGRAVISGHRRRDYITDLLARRAVRFIHGTAGRSPFFLTVSTYAPHAPAIPAPRHRHMFRRLALPGGPAFDAPNTRPPAWLGRRGPLGLVQRQRLQREYRMRARSVQAVDELIGRVRAALRAERVARRTYIVFASDNGYHLGEHRLMAGKRTAFDTDIRVPLIVVGPGVRRGASTSAPAGTVDLAPTFSAWAGVPADARREGRSLVPLLAGRTPRGWRRSLLVEHTHHGAVRGDPDVQGWAAGQPSTYRALRTRDTTYVEYLNGRREFYDRRTDPGELHNRYGRLSRARRARLSAAVARYASCHGARDCWAAGR